MTHAARPPASGTRDMVTIDTGSGTNQNHRCVVVIISQIAKVTVIMVTVTIVIIKYLIGTLYNVLSISRFTMLK